ncbi:flavin reductase family protein [Nitrososphaera sp.]|uniref:flavin reductase family protein n=1 Tax=Nitrososphaera sp. TaxID=1971748 RepID=UPI00307F2483
MSLQKKKQENVHRYFATTVGLITTTKDRRPSGSGDKGNVMACEWTMQVSYDPMLIAIFIHDSPTLWNIQKTGFFGVNIASDSQAELVNIAGGYSGTEIDKLAVPRTFETFYGKHVPLVKGCALCAECKVKLVQEVGDHVMVVGEATSASFDETKSPLIYTRGNYRRLGGKIPSGRKTVRLPPSAFLEFKKMSGGQFVLKCAVGLVHTKEGGTKRTLFVRSGQDGRWMLPMTPVDRGTSYAKALSEYLIKSAGVRAKVGSIVRLERAVLKPSSTGGEKQQQKQKQQRQDVLRANFVVFECQALPAQQQQRLLPVDGEWRWWFADRPPRGALLRSLAQDS